MKNPTESGLVRACLDLLHLRKVYAWRQNTTGVFDPAKRRFRTFHGLAGVSDILGVLPGGRFLALECKTERGRVTRDQKVFLDAVRANGGLAAVIRDLRELELFLNEIGV